MRKKMILSFLAGVIVTVLAIIATITIVPSAKAEETTSSNIAVVNVEKLSMQKLITLLQQVRTEIQDSDTLIFYDKLIEKYELKNTTNIDEPGFPDIKKVYNNALTLPLQEAGKQINDPEIKTFYYRFLQQSGLLDILPD